MLNTWPTGNQHKYQHKDLSNQMKQEKHSITSVFSKVPPPIVQKIKVEDERRTQPPHIRFKLTLYDALSSKFVVAKYQISLMQHQSTKKYIFW